MNNKNLASFYHRLADDVHTQTIEGTAFERRADIHVDHAVKFLEQIQAAKRSNDFPHFDLVRHFHLLLKLVEDMINENDTIIDVDLP